MEDPQILDNEVKEITIASGLFRWQWHFKHAGIIISLHLIIAFAVNYLFPFFPKIIDDGLSFLSLILIIFGTFLITLYVCRTGYQWSWGTTLVLGSIIFFGCFVYTMNSLDHWIDAFSQKLQYSTSLSNRELEKILEIALVGIMYSFWAIITIEILVLLGRFIRAIYNVINKEN